MGLDYLNKKNWHTGSIKNIAKVWEKEQKHLEQMKKQEDYQKKRLEEKSAYEMKVLQVEAGLIPASALDKQDFIYNNPALQQKNEQTNEEYLLGKKVDINNFNKKDNNNNINKQPIVTEDTTNKICENFTLLHEDPLFRIMQEEQRMKEKILNNPLEMKQICDQIENKQQKKKHKKEKKDKKEKKEKKDKKEKKQKSKSKNKKVEHKSHKKSSKRSNSTDKKRKNKRTKKSSSRSSSSDSSSSRSRSRSKDKDNKLYQQYLAKKLGPILVKDDKGNTRADFGLMKRKFRNNLRPEEKIQMTNEEREQMIKEMQNNAKNVRQLREQEFEGEHQTEQTISEIHGKQQNPKFLQNVNKSFFDEKNNLNSISENIERNRFNQVKNIQKFDKLKY